MKILRLAFIAALSLQCVSASAQNGVTISLVVGFKAGGTSSTSARIIAQAIEETTAHRVIVENRPGATGLIAAEWVKRQKPDGRTLLFMSSASSLSVPPSDELIPVALIATYDYFVVTGKDVSATLAGYFKAAKQNRSLQSVATSGAGGMSHLLGEKLFRDHNVPILHVPYLSSADAILTVLGGHVALAIVPYPDYIGYKGDNRLRVIAKTGESIAVEGWMGVFAPAKTSVEEIHRLSEMFRIAAEKSKKKLENAGFFVVWKGGNELRRLHERDYADFLPELTRLGIKP